MPQCSGIAQAGFTHNAMTAWKIDTDESFSERIRPFMDEGAVTHLYLRTLYPGKWEYPLFAMMHARSSEELESLLDSLTRRSGLNDRLVLRSLYEIQEEKSALFFTRFHGMGDRQTMIDIGKIYCGGSSTGDGLRYGTDGLRDAHGNAPHATAALSRRAASPSWSGARPKPAICTACTATLTRKIKNMTVN